MSVSFLPLTLRVCACAEEVRRACRRSRIGAGGEGGREGGWPTIVIQGKAATLGTIHNPIQKLALGPFSCIAKWHTARAVAETGDRGNHQTTTYGVGL